MLLHGSAYSKQPLRSNRQQMSVQGQRLCVKKASCTRQPQREILCNIGLLTRRTVYMLKVMQELVSADASFVSCIWTAAKR